MYDGSTTAFLDRDDNSVIQDVDLQTQVENNTMILQAIITILVTIISIIFFVAA